MTERGKPTDEDTIEVAVETPRQLAPHTRLLLVAGLASSFIIFGLSVSGPTSAFVGLDGILFARDTLITDYIELGGIGAAFLNAGLVTLIAVSIYWYSGAAVGGDAVACLMLVLGFSLFGKNLLNIWPILGGVYLYSWFRDQPFRDHINTAFFGCALAPVFSEVLFSTTLSLWASLPLSLLTGVAMGFIMPPVSAQLFRAHDGHTLYNMGFTAGVIGTLVVAIYISNGFVPEPVFYWSTESTLTLAPFLVALFLTMIICGQIVDPNCFEQFRRLIAMPGQSPSDFTEMAGDGAVLLNMGALGLLSMLYVFVVGADLNGPVIGAILSVVGFGAFGKHVLNCLPVVAGVFLAVVLQGGDPANPGLILAALFSTTLAPMAGCFGWYWGITAGFIHVSAAQTVGVLHGGLNLYNNGFAAGFVAAILTPIAIALHTGFKGRSTEKL